MWRTVGYPWTAGTSPCGCYRQVVRVVRRDAVHLFQRRFGLLGFWVRVPPPSIHHADTPVTNVVSLLNKTSFSFPTERYGTQKGK